MQYWGVAGNPGGDLLGDEAGDDLEGDDGGVEVGVEAADERLGVVAAADLALTEDGAGAPDEVQMSSSPRSWAAILALATHSVSKFFSKPLTTKALT